MKANLISTVLFLSVAKIAFAQCTGGTNGGAINPAPTTSYQTMNCVAGDRYYTFVVGAAGCFPQYDFSFCAADGGSASFDTQITILDNTGVAVAGGYNDDFCGLQSHLTFTPTQAGTYRVHITQYTCIATTAAATLSYKYANSYTSTPQYTMVGSATSVGPCITLTSNSIGQTGCAWDINSTLNFLAPFSYDFTVNLGSSNAGADGMAFVIQNDPRGLCACGQNGGALAAGGITNSLTVEMDTYLNYEDRDDFTTAPIGCAGIEDPDHLDLWINGVVNPDLDANCNAIAPGERPVTPSAVRLQNPLGTDYDIENGLDHILRISFTPGPGGNGTITASIMNTALTITYGTISGTVNPLTVFGTNTPYFGFTASTGALTNQQTFCNPSVLLPIELLYMNARCSDDGIIISWATASETNNKEFVIERSVDAINYKAIATVAGHGTTSNQNEYSYTDRPESNGAFYYHLKQVDLAGLINYYSLNKSIENNCAETDNPVVIYPNPAANLLYLEANINTTTNIDISNALGQIMYATVLEKSGIKNKVAVDTKNLPAGIYFVKVSNEFISTIKKIEIRR